MSTQKRTSKSLVMLCECAVMLALAFALSCAKLFKMPMGGSVTVASMLPIMLISVKYGPTVGVLTSFVYSLTQLLQAVFEGDVFVWCTTAKTTVICALFDYIVPFTILGLAGIFYHKLRLTKNQEINIYIGITSVVLARFLCHFITGVAIWGQWAEGMSPYLYSFIYNGSFLSADFLICIVVAVLMMRKQEIRRLLSIKE